MTWLKAVERRGQSVLISSYFYNGIQTKYFQKILGLAVGLDHYLILDYVNYYSQEEVETFEKNILPLLQKSNFEIIREWLDKLYLKATGLLEFSEEIKQKNMLEVQQNCVHYFEQFSELSLQFGPAMYLPILIEKIIEATIQKIVEKDIKSEKEKALHLFTSSHVPTEGTKELINLCKISETENISENITKHLQQFGWLSFTKFVGEPWTFELILQRMQNVDKNVRLEYEYIKNKQETQELITKYNISLSDQKIIWIAKEVSYFRSYRLDVYTKAGYNIKNLLAVIAEKLEINVTDVVFLTYTEIVLLLQSEENADRSEIAKRKNNFWQMKFSLGTIRFQYEEPFEVVLMKEIKLQEFKGRIAFPGKVRGRVQIIRGVLEFDKMRLGDVLVTSMTTPDFVPLMEKAAAIVTDEGGMTCHAAIVARELHKPCIVGTEVATKALKDGDLIEVDATKGTVRKIP